MSDDVGNTTRETNNDEAENTRSAVSDRASLFDAILPGAWWWACLSMVGNPRRQTGLREGVKNNVFLGDLSQMWVGGVADSQTRSKPLKKTNHPENRLFRPKFYLLFSQISQKPWGGCVNRFGKGLQKKLDSFPNYNL